MEKTRAEQEKRRTAPVGVFDSGVGGVSVLRALVRLLPGEDFYFFGDSANAPYGTRPVEEIRRLTLSHVDRMITEKKVKAVVVACNTATSAAISLLRQTFTAVPVIGIEPALKPAALTGHHPKVVVMATPQTVAGEKFHHLLGQYEAEANVVPLGCPGLMEYVEQGIFEGEDLERCLKELLLPVMQEPIDAVVLGCTHYPFVRGAITRVLGPSVRIFDGSEGTAHQLQRRLEQEGLLNGRTAGGRVVFEMSLPEKEALARRLLEQEPMESRE